MPLAVARVIDKKPYLALGLLFLVMVSQLMYWPLRWEFNITSGQLGYAFFLAVLLMAGPNALAQLVRQAPVLWLAAGLFALTSLIASWNGADFGLAIRRWYAYGGHAALAAGVALMIVFLGVSISRVLLCLLYACAVLLLGELLVIIDNWLMFSHLAPGRVYTPTYFNHIRNFAHVPTLGLALGLWLGWSARPAWSRYLGHGFALFNMTVLMWAAGRVSLAVVPLLVLAYCWLGFERGRLPKLLLLIAYGLLAYGFLAASGQDQMLSNATQRMSEDASAFETVVSGPQAGDKSDMEKLGSGRVGLWRETLQLSRAHWLLGSGGDAFLAAHLDPDIRPNKTAAHPHNWVLRLLLEYGVLGLALVLLILTGLARRIFRVEHFPARNEAARARALVYVLALVWLLYGLVSGTLYYAWPLHVFMVLLGCLLAIASFGIEQDAQA